MLGTLPLMLALRVSPAERSHEASMLRDLREGWSEFRSRPWIWVTTLQYAVVMMSWYGAFTVLGPAVARAHLGGAAAWGAITGAESLGLIAGGMASLRFTVARPIRFVVLSGAGIAVAPLALAMLWPLPLICVEAFVLGIVMEIMMVQWTVALATNVRPEILARVSSYDALGVASSPCLHACLVPAGPLATWISVSRHPVRRGRADPGRVRARVHPAYRPAVPERAGALSGGWCAPSRCWSPLPYAPAGSMR